MTAASLVVRRAPRGRYVLVDRFRPRTAPFVARLSGELGAALFECDMRDAIAREVCLTGMYEPPLSRLLARWLPRDAVVVDAGANWGYFTLLCAGLARTGRILAIEPDPRQHARLAANVRLNAFAHATPIAAAAGATRGRVRLAGYGPDDDNRGTSRVATDAETAALDVECLGIDAITAGLPRIDLVKIDVEGFELEVLRGLEDGLARRRIRVIVLELHPGLLARRGATPDACVSLLEEHGYRGWTIDMSPRTYNRAVRRDIAPERLLLPAEAWRASAWPHVVFAAPGVRLAR
jgi:FkbM family methyltransferase